MLVWGNRSRQGCDLTLWGEVQNQGVGLLVPLKACPALWWSLHPVSSHSLPWCVCVALSFLRGHRSLELGLSDDLIFLQ